MKWIENCLEWQVQRAVTISPNCSWSPVPRKYSQWLMQDTILFINDVVCGTECCLSHSHSHLSLQMTQNWNNGWYIRLSCWQKEGSQRARETDEQEMKDLITGKLNCEERFNNRKCKVHHLERNSPIYKFTSRANWQVSSFWEKDVAEILVDETWIWASDVHCGKGSQCHSALGENAQQAEGGDPSSLYSPGELTQGMLPDLGSLVQNRHGYTGLSPMRGMKSLRLEYLSYEEWLKKLGLFNLEMWRLRMSLSVCLNKC